jgi:Holliday junction resolvase RusA-like endonuclease
MRVIRINAEAVGKQSPLWGNGHSYLPAKTADFQKLVAWEYVRQGGENFGKNAISIVLHIEKGFPKSYSKAKRDKLRSQICTEKPDCSNVLKAIEDGLQGVAFDNDKQVVFVSMSKRWTDESCIVLKVEPIL